MEQSYRLPVGLLAGAALLLSSSAYAADDPTQDASNRECAAIFAQANFPPAWKKLYLWAIYTPESFMGFICLAKQNGARVRFLPGGLFDLNGFEIKGKQRTVRVALEEVPVPGGDLNWPLLVPAKVNINGGSYTVTNENIREIFAEIVAAASNR